jgi:hypothetical protein
MVNGSGGKFDEPKAPAVAGGTVAAAPATAAPAAPSKGK